VLGVCLGSQLLASALGATGRGPPAGNGAYANQAFRFGELERGAG
jgi:GMP synthase-like glutamine amidotransferase